MAYLWDDIPSLRACSLSSRLITEAAQSLLFSTVALRSGEKLATGRWKWTEWVLDLLRAAARSPPPLCKLHKIYTHYPNIIDLISFQI